jgi:hypothetical protein
MQRFRVICRYDSSNRKMVVMLVTGQDDGVVDASCFCPYFPVSLLASSKCLSNLVCLAFWVCVGLFSAG